MVPVAFLECEVDSSHPQQSRIHLSLRSSVGIEISCFHGLKLNFLRLYLHVVVWMVLTISRMSNAVIKRHQ